MATAPTESEQNIVFLGSNARTTQQLDLHASLNERRSHLFQKIRRHSTAGNTLRLYDFRRLKTSHLVNLHFLEEEISVLDRQVYQVGIRSGSHENNGGRDALGLQRDPIVPNEEEFVTDSMLLKLRRLLKEYGSQKMPIAMPIYTYTRMDEALAAFNKVMAMETFSLIDDKDNYKERSELHPYEIYQTRLVRVDLGTRTEHDPFRRGIQKTLQQLRYWRMCNKSQEDEERVQKR